MMRLWQLLLTLALLGTPCSLMAEGTLIKVMSQEQFDVAVERINSGKETHLILKKGNYNLHTSINAIAPLSIKGKNATISCATRLCSTETERQTETHNIYKLNRKLSPFTMFYDKKGKLLSVTESVIDSVRVNYVDGEIESSKEYKIGEIIKIPIARNLTHLKNKVFACAYGYFDCGWKAVSFQLDKSDETYFYCTTLSDCPTKNYQYDKMVYKKPIRFVVYNAEIKENAIFYDDEYLYTPKGISVLYYLCNNDSFHKIPTITVSKDFELDNVKFLGFAGIFVNSKMDNACVINNCIFQNSLGHALSINKENGASAIKAIVTDCLFKDCSIYFGDVLHLRSTFYGPSCILMQRCVLSRYTDGNVIYKNASPSVYVSGDVELKGNVIYNSCRGHLNLRYGNISASGNILYNTDYFNSHPMRNYSNDWGLVYCDHIYKNTDDALNDKTHRILLENNLLYGAYAYGGDARGIFIDDGRGNVTCKNNVILNTQLFSIDARNVKLHDAASARIKYEGNVVSSAYRLEAGPAVKGANIPISSRNFLLSTKKNKISNVELLNGDHRLDIDASSSCDGTRIKVSRDLYKTLKRHPTFDRIKKFL